jgi:RimJ/RimL family protein N-acetyltransferase
MQGERVRLEPLDPAAHGEGLYAAGHEGDPELWAYLPEGPFAVRGEFDAYLARRAAAADEECFTVVAPRAGAAGIASYMRISEEHGSIEIGGIWFGAALQRTPAATEAIFLLALRAFDELGYRRLEWKCNALNQRSRRAAERFGFVYEGTHRQAMVLKGRNRDTAWYSITDGEWPGVRAGFERWLASENFDSAGGQRATLETLRAAG